MPQTPNLTSKPIRHLVILCHPETDSFNAAVAETYCKTVRECGQETVVRDLYRLSFDPVLKKNEMPGRQNYKMAPDVAVEFEYLSQASAVVFIYPIWFGTPPAMLKGYVDRVMGANFDFRAIQDHNDHPLYHKRLLSFSSSGSSRPWLEQRGVYLALKTGFDCYLATAFSMSLSRHVLFDSVVPGLKARFVEENMIEVGNEARSLCTKLLRDPDALAA